MSTAEIFPIRGLKGFRVGMGEERLAGSPDAPGRKRPRINNLGYHYYLTDAGAVHSDLVACFQHFDVTALGDTSCLKDLRWPSVRRPEGTTGNYYFYLGRTRFPEVYQRIVDLPPASEILFTGLPGSGKTVVAAAVSGYLLVHRVGNRRIVYVVGHQYAVDPLEVLKEALVLAYVDDCDTIEELSKIKTLQHLVLFCRRTKTENLIFVVDEWNELDPKRSRHVVDPKNFDYRKALKNASYFHVLVKVCSSKSEDSLEYYSSDKRLPRIEFNDPFTEDELKTWIAGTKFNGLKSDTTLMEFYTGFRPRLLKFYAESTGLADYDDHCQPYVKSISTFVNGLNAGPELERAMRMAVGAVINIRDIEHVQWDWSYVVQVSPVASRVKCASDHLSTILADAVLERSQSLMRLCDSVERTIWAAAVERDANKATAMNSARIGWNVEALVISVVKTTKVLLGQKFAKWKHYEHDGELTALLDTTVAELLDGVLYVPLRFNETAVDLVVIKLVKKDDGSYCVVIQGFQISVSTLKRKLAKDSHSRWENEIAPKWEAAFPRAKERNVTYTYILPESCPNELKNGIQIARFGEIDKVLAFVDSLRLEDPVVAEMGPLVVCSGRVCTRSEPARRCRNSKRTTEKDYFCCEAHRQDVWQEQQGQHLVM